MSEHRMTRGAAIHAKCIDCCCGVAHEVRKCDIKKCPLWVYRLGRECSMENEEEAEDVKVQG